MLARPLRPSPYEDCISNRQRRALRGPSQRERLNAARSAQDASGMRIRISRRVKNQLDFSNELEVWRAPVQTGIAQRKSLGNLAMTVFDTTQQPLRCLQDFTQESLEALLDERYSSLFEDTPPIAVTGTRLFGSKARPFIALTLAAGGVAYAEQQAIRSIVAPELWLDDSHQLDHELHVSLGQVYAPSQAPTILAQLTPVVPRYVQFGPATVLVQQH